MKKILNPLIMFSFGLILGILSRLLDIYTQNLGNIFSQFAIWILIGTIISIYSKSKKSAMINVLTFCLGMLITYYFTTYIIKGVYSDIFIIGWTIFGISSAILAYFTWMTKEDGILPKIISGGIVIVSFLSSVIFFGKLRFYDFVINAILIFLLFFKKIER